MDKIAQLRPSLHVLTAGAAVVALLVALKLYRRVGRTPRLIRPPRKSFLFGATEDVFSAPDSGTVYSAWEEKYGPVYEMPSSLGSKILVLGDPKAVTHVFENDTTTYQQLSFARAISRRYFGDILLVQEGETHKRQRRAMSLGFSISAIRDLLPVFLDSANKLTSQWDALLDSQSCAGDSIIIDIQKWMNYISLDSIGKGAFSHDFGSLVGNRSPVMEAIDAFESLKPALSTMILFLLGPLFPTLLVYMPTERARIVAALCKGVRETAKKLLSKESDLEKSSTPRVVDKSILGALIKSKTANSKMSMSVKEIEAQQLLISAGYETTSITLTWALIELARNPKIQKTLRAELDGQIAGKEATYDNIMNLPYLDAFVSEVLRLHPAEQEVMREVTRDDIIPLTKPIVTASGTVIDNLPVSKGTNIRVPIIGINRSEALWGSNAAVFDPTRWLDEKAGGFSDQRKVEIPGYKHLLTFGHGPRMCLGRMFVLTEIKAVLSVLVRKFAFEFPGGTGVKIGHHRSFFLKPKVVGEVGSMVPLMVRRVPKE